MGHIGLQPQYIHESGGYNIKGGSSDEELGTQPIGESLSNVGAFAIVLEKVPIDVSQRVTNAINCPTIGIGAGPHCSGQVLVTNDVLGLTPNFSPKFLKQYANGAQLFTDALTQFKTDVEGGSFPTTEHGYGK